MIMKHILPLLIGCILLCTACNQTKQNPETEKSNIDRLLHDWHKHAADANLAHYMDAMYEDAIYMGTDATERWTKNEFRAFCVPHFDRKKTWHFTSIKRFIALDANGQTAWFDELLDTQMNICRGSGILKKVDKEWKIVQYVLSMTIPNALSNEVVRLKTPIEDSMKHTLRQKP
jgi:ketosteroid isomerase-like protein